MGAAHLLDRAPDRFDAGRQRIRLAFATDVHEIHLGRIVEEVVVQGADAEPVRKRGIHRGIDFVFEHHRVTHDHRVTVGHRPERRP